MACSNRRRTEMSATSGIDCAPGGLSPRRRLTTNFAARRILSAAGIAFPTSLISKERPMGSKRLDRRELLKHGATLAGGLTLGAVAPASAQTPAAGGQAPAPGPKMLRGDKDLIAYGERSHFVTSVRIPHGGRPSPDAFGLVFHVASPLQDSVGVITPSSLHYVATTRGSFIPDIDPREHRFMIHGMVDRPLTFTIEDLK